MSNINTVFEIQKIQTKPVYLLSERECVCLLKPGRSVIEVSTGLEGRDRCGLIPVGCEVSEVTTSGLVYNLSGHRMAFGELISTSNAIAEGANEVSVESSHSLLWTLSYESDQVKCPNQCDEH